jgi:hypothetical protein
MPLRPDAAELSDKQTLVNTGEEATADRRNVAPIEGEKLVLESRP